MVALLNPDQIHDFGFVGRADLIFVEIQKSDCRVRFNSFPNDGFSDYEFAVEPFDLDGYNVTVVVLQCNF